MPEKLSRLPVAGIRAVFSDLDDTLTEAGQIAPATFAALARWKASGRRLVIVSGRPAGWGDCLMRLWPLDALIFENGAGVMTRDGDRVRTVSLAPQTDLAAQHARLQSVFEGLRKKIPHLKLATDQPYRLLDYAIDFTEEPPRLSAQELEQVLQSLSKESGITHKLSSIHVNYWCGSHTKVTACEYLLDQFGKSWGITRETTVYSGDSPNDEPLFEYFVHTVGVANIQKFLARMKTGPRYLTSSPGGSGFQEIIEHLLAGR